MLLKRILVSIAIVMLIAAVAVAVSRDMQGRNQPQLQVTNPSGLTERTPQTTLRLVPNPAEPDSAGNIPIDVAINTYGNKITAVQFALSYDPSALRFVSISPDEAFFQGQILEKNIDETNGTIVYALGLSPQQINNPIQGNDHVAELRFVPRHKGQTTIKFTKASASSAGISVSMIHAVEDTIVKLNY